MAKILVIDDEQSIRSGVKDLLELKGHTVFTAKSGDEGIKLAQKQLPDLILCDIIMPKTDGYSVLKEIRNNPSTTLTPFIFLTSKSDMTELRYGMEMGADDYISKPFFANDLFKSIETRLHKQKIISERLSAKNLLAIPQPDSQPFNDYIFVMVGNQMEFLKIPQIECVTAFGEYTNVYLDGGKKLVVRKFLKEWEAFLPKNIFLRIHRSTIINLEYVEKIEKFFKRSFIVHLKFIKQPFIISQRYSAKLKAKNLF